MASANPYDFACSSPLDVLKKAESANAINQLALAQLPLAEMILFFVCMLFQLRLGYSSNALIHFVRKAGIDVLTWRLSS